MATSYRLYGLNSDGKIAAAAEWIEANSDDEAIVLVRVKHAELACELWDGNRLVAWIEAKRLSAQGAGVCPPSNGEL